MIRRRVASEGVKSIKTGRIGSNAVVPLAVRCKERLPECSQKCSQNKIGIHGGGVHETEKLEHGLIT